MHMGISLVGVTLNCHYNDNIASNSSLAWLVFSLIPWIIDVNHVSAITSVPRHTAPERKCDA
jgi:hypothetical protein